MKYIPSHQVEASIMNLPNLPVVKRWPPRKTRVNIDSHIQVKPIIDPKVDRPTISNPGLAARTRVANSKIEIDFCIASLPRMTARIHKVARTAGTSDVQRMTLSCMLLPFQRPL